MFSRLKTLALGTGLLLGAVPVACQTQQHTEHTTHTSGSRSHIRWIHDGRSVEMRTDGQVELSDAQTEVHRLSPGGRFSLEERVVGRPDRRVEYRAAADGTLTRAYFVNGRAEAWDASACTWLAALLPELARETGVDAEARVARIHAQRGTAGVLEEVGRIRSGSSQAAHLRALLANHPLSAAEIARVLQHVRRIDSDSQKSSLLHTIAERREFEQSTVQRAFFEAVGTIGSDSLRRGVLAAVLGRGHPSEATLVGVLESAAAIGSDSQKGSLLTEVAELYTLASPRVRDAFFAVAGGIDSDSQRARVLTTVLTRQGERSDVVLAAVRSAQEIGSDSQKATVLLAVPPARLRDRTVADAFMDVMRSIDSDSQRGRVATFALENRS